MLNQVTIIGVVVEVFEERGAMYVALQTGGGKKRDGGVFESNALVRCYAEAVKAQLNDIAPGQLVRVDAEVKARRKSQGGGWFSDVEAWRVSTLTMPMPKVLGAQHSRGQAPADDDSDMTPF